MVGIELYMAVTNHGASSINLHMMVIDSADGLKSFIHTSLSL